MSVDYAQMTKKDLTAEIRSNLESNQAWLERGIVAIYQRQTADEQVSHMTSHDNGVGFNGVDAELLSSFAEWILSGKRLTPGQRKWAVRKMKKYAGQLARIVRGEV